VLERGRDRYKAEEEEEEEEGGGCSTRALSAGEKGEREEGADYWSPRAPGTMLTSITTVWHMCVCVCVDD